MFGSRVRFIIVLHTLALSCACATDLNTSVVRIVAIRDAGLAALSSGFYFRLDNKVGVLTALHGVVGASRVTAKNELTESELHLEKVDVTNDLAFLTGVAESAATRPLSPASWRSEGVAKVVGYPLGLMTQRSDRIESRDVPIAKLIELVSADLFPKLQERKSPDLAANVLSVMGKLLPGDSGAPILSSRGHVVGIGSGGLAGGLADNNWAIPIESAKWVAIMQARPELLRVASLPADAAFQILEMSPTGKIRTSGSTVMGLGDLREITVNLHRPGFLKDCPNLPETAQLIADPVSGDPALTANVVGGCKAKIAVTNETTGVVKLRLVGAAPYVLFNSEETHPLAAKEWDASVTPSPGMRVVVSLSSYAGLCQSLAQEHGMFEAILRAKAQSLRGLFDKADPKFNYLNAVNVIATERTLPLSPDEIHTYWRDNELLEVMSGLCISKQGGDLMVSSIFSGALAGELPEPFIVNLNVSEKEFRTNRDLHSATMLYALAQEAHSRNLDQYIVISYLERARELAMQIRDESRQALLAAISSSLKDAGAPVGPLTQ
jgi:hypothetical protein